VVRRRRAVASGRRPDGRRALPVQPRDKLQGFYPAGPVSFIAELNGGARSRASADDLRAVAPEPDLKKDAAMSQHAPFVLQLLRHGGRRCP
jgi:hypothetical protein